MIGSGWQWSAVIGSDWQWLAVIGKVLLYHTAFKLYSLWHVSYLRENLYGSYMCSRVSRFPYDLACCPDSAEPPQLLGSEPSYFPVLVSPSLPPYSSPCSKIASPSSKLRSNRLISYKPLSFVFPAGFVPTSVLPINHRTSVMASSSKEKGFASQLSLASC